jgi:hypothetical protein
MQSNQNALVMTKGLTLQQKKFCEIYTSETEFYGNGVRSYCEAYGKEVKSESSYNAAKKCASVLLTNSNILAYINKLLTDQGLNEVNVDKQLSFLIQQNSDFGTKLGAIKEFNALKERITQKLQLQTGEYEVSIGRRSENKG